MRLSPDEAVSLSASIRAAADSLIAGEADRHDVDILPNADAHRRSLGFTLADVERAVFDPTRWRPDESSPARLVCVGERGLEVVAAFAHEVPMVLVVRQAKDHDTGSTSWRRGRSEEHTSELQSRFDLVCRLLLEKKNHSFNDRSSP